MPSDDALPQLFESWRRREDALRGWLQTVPAAGVERYRRMSYAGVARRAAGVEGRLDAVVRAHGGASTVAGTEADDWLKLRGEMEDEGWATIGEMAFGRGEAWALRLAAHEASRRDPAREPGVMPSDGMRFCSARKLLWNWCRRRLLRRPVAPLVKPMPKLRQQRAALRERAGALAPDAPEWQLATALTALFNRQLPRLARIEVVPLVGGHAVVMRWGFWSWETCSSGLSLAGEDGLAGVALAVQSFAADQTHRSWPLRLDENEMRRAHRADPDWSSGLPLPKASLTEHELRIWFGADDAPAFEFPAIRLAA